MGMLDGKVAVVTGAGRGVGAAHARLLADRGAAVVVNDLGTEIAGSGSDMTLARVVVDEITAAGGRAATNTDDVASWAGAKSLVDQAVDDFGRLDILVNNAGILRDAMSFNLTEADWDAVIRVHLKGHAATARFAAEHWRARSKAGETVAGRIVNTTSDSGLWGQAGQMNYAAAKSGIVGMTLVLARELRNYGVTANCVAPRALTRMTSLAPGAEEYMAGPEWSADNVSPVVCWLASDAAADVSGQVFVVYGTKVRLIAGFEEVRTIDRDVGRWTPEELVAHKDELFAGRRSKVPRPLGF